MYLYGSMVNKDTNAVIEVPALETKVHDNNNKIKAISMEAIELSLGKLLQLRRKI